MTLTNYFGKAELNPRVRCAFGNIYIQSHRWRARFSAADLNSGLLAINQSSGWWVFPRARSRYRRVLFHLVLPIKKALVGWAIDLCTEIKFGKFHGAVLILGPRANQEKLLSVFCPKMSSSLGRSSKNETCSYFLTEGSFWHKVNTSSKKHAIVTSLKDTNKCVIDIFAWFATTAHDATRKCATEKEMCF